ncbi:DegT/DnrJ/EryC1/StrS family aminotransferase [Candidatus Pelagibacter sp.]|jgi:dTDP-3-amino-2,3,6-trideoxy-4-keto-D-glucose/dTDP-3-amino-3,4,6-trideoxy-alpha-D-glucose/dTDP-2,6-dideoxy-D-kanosamine transaminase|nr:DegT/DnrJ/EryC1/StrS family aminotransferase [Candidatus Pelagibacter sp.]|tara:strand:+ start:5234 stop:6334 length:1101 start_codon:yes stop_codon:yes gene_type:complete
MRVPYNYLPMEFRKNNEILSRWKKLIQSTDFTLGKDMIEFEKKFAKYIGAKYVISTNNGTDALILSLKSIGVKKGDEVITVSNTFYASAGAIVACGAKPILVDCDDRYQIDIKEIKKKISKRTKAIMPVHWGGASPDMFSIMKLAKKYKIHVVEDACMGIGAKIKGRSPGTFGTINAFSMHPLKSLNVMGDGGMVATNNKKIFDWIKKFRNHGMIDRDHIEFWGVNMRLQPLQAVVALEGLKKIDRVIKKRNENAKEMDRLLSTLSPNLIIPRRLKGYKETFALYMCLVVNRDELLKHLIKNKIEAKIHYPIPLNKQEAAKNLNLNQNNFKNSNEQAQKIITLPIHQYLTKTQLSFMFKKIKQFYK